MALYRCSGTSDPGRLGKIDLVAVGCTVPGSNKIILAMVDLNANTILYLTVTLEEAFCPANRLETSYPPKNGSWLDIVEIELSSLCRQCLGTNRIPDFDTLMNLLKT